MAHYLWKNTIQFNGQCVWEGRFEALKSKWFCLHTTKKEVNENSICCSWYVFDRHIVIYSEFFIFQFDKILMILSTGPFLKTFGK